MTMPFVRFRQFVDTIEGWEVIKDEAHTVWVKQSNDQEEVYCFTYFEKETIVFSQTENTDIEQPLLIGFQEVTRREQDIIELDFSLANHRFRIRANVDEINSTNWVDITFFMFDDTEKEWDLFIPHTVTQQVKKELRTVCDLFKEVLASIPRFRLLFATGNIRFDIEDDRWMQYV